MTYQHGDKHFFMQNLFKHVWEWVNRFNVVMYDSCCQLCCNWSRRKPEIKDPAHRSTML